MAFTEALRLVVEADTKGAVAGIERLGNAAERDLGKADKSLDRWGNRLTKVGTGLITFGAVAATGLAMAAQSAGELEQAVGGTEAVFGDARKTVDDFAENAAEKVGLSQTAFRNLSTVVGAQLKNMGFSLDEAATQSIKLVEIGADLAATYGGTTQEAVEALGAALRGEADPAERFGLALNQTAVNAKAVEMGLAESTSAVDANAKAQATLALIMEQSADAQGQFAREGDTLAGQQQRLAAQFEDLKAEIGAGAIPVMKTLAQTASTVTGALSDANEASGGWLGKAATIGTVGALAAGGLSVVVGQAIKMRDNLAAARDGVQALTGKLGGLKATAALTAGVAGIAGVAVALHQLGEARRAAEIERVAEEFASLGDDVEDFADNALPKLQKFDKVDDVFRDLLDTNAEAAERFVDMAEAAGVASDEIDDMRAAIEDKKSADAQASVDAKANAEAVEDQADAMDDSADSTDDATSALEDYANALKAATDPLFAVMDAQTSLTDARRDAKDAEEALQEAIKEHGPNSREAADAQRDLTDAQDETVRSAIDLQGAANNLQAAIEADRISLSDATAALDELVAQGVLTRAEADRMAWSFGVAANTADALAVDRVFDVEAEDKASAVISNIKSGLFGIQDKHVTVTATGQWLWDRTFGNIFGGKRARGGPVAASKIYEVNEQGAPELLEQNGRTFLLPGKDGQVVPVGGAVGGGGGGGGQTVIIDMTGAIVADSRQFERMVVDAFQAAGRKGVAINVRGRSV